MDNEEMDFTNSKMLREKAEQKLKQEQKKLDAGTKLLDEKRLLHELQVHQIELEMQNEELKLAYDATETALRKYTLLYDLAPMGYFTLDADATIEELNFTGAEVLDQRRITLVGRNFKTFVSESTLLTFESFFGRVFSSGSKESCTIKLNNDKGSVVYVEGVVVADEHKCLLSVVDVSNFKKSV
jgi:PAS domain-containing protein